jgi:hypothetical protein
MSATEQAAAIGLCLVAMWAMALWSRRIEIRCGQQDRIKDLEDLVTHMWVHDGYERNGYWQMTSEQKAMYDEIVNREPL